MYRHRSFSRLAAVAALGACVAAGPAASTAAAACAGASANPASASRVEISRSTLCLLNGQRTSRGLHKLRLSPRLSRAARSHSGDMARKHYFNHVSKTGKDVVDRLFRTGYLGSARSWVVGENLAWGSGRRGTPGKIVRSWMRSPGHRANILNGRFRQVGIGVVDRTPSRRFSSGATYTTTFGARG